MSMIGAKFGWVGCHIKALCHINSSLGMRLVGTYNVQQRHIKRFSPAGNESELQVTTVAVI